MWWPFAFRTSVAAISCAGKYLYLTLLMVLAIISPIHGDTFLIITEETQNGEAFPQPFPSKEGLMTVLFDQGHIIFDTGAYAAKVDWDHLSFSEPLDIARQGGAHFLIAARIESQLQKKSDKAVRIVSRALYFLLDVDNSALLGRGVLSMDNYGQEEELNYNTILFSLGKKLADELLRIWEESSYPL